MAAGRPSLVPGAVETCKLEEGDQMASCVDSMSLKGRRAWWVWVCTLAGPQVGTQAFECRKTLM